MKRAWKFFVKFSLGWITWVIVFILCLIGNILTWEWDETIGYDAEKIITEILGKSTWNIMMFQKTDYPDEKNI